MHGEYYIRIPKLRIVRKLVEKVNKKDIFCIARAKRTLSFDEVLVFDENMKLPRSYTINKGDEFYVVPSYITVDSEALWKMRFLAFGGKVIQADYLFCSIPYRRKYQGQPYKYFFKDHKFA